MNLDLELLRQLAEEDPDAAKEMVRQYRKAMIVLARHDPSWFCQYVLKDRDGGMIRQKQHHHDMHKLIMDNFRSVIWTYPACGKAADIEEFVPTPSGWVQLKNIEVGDLVFSRDGKPTQVEYVSPVFTGHDCYKISFDDGTSVVVDADHLWAAYHTLDRHKNPQPLRTVSTREIAASVKHGDRNTWAIPIAAPVQYEEAALPIPPYVLGVWLGDGCRRSSTVVCHKDDREIIDRCRALLDEECAERTVKRNPNVLVTRLGGKQFSIKLKALGLHSNQTGVNTKHIPEIYLRGSVEQRLELLAGLLDTDGTTQLPAGGRIELCFCHKPLADGAVELARSLGIKVSVQSSPAKLYGRVTSTRYRINFTFREPLFHLKRKRDIQMAFKPSRRTQTRAKYIVSVDQVESVPTKCIRVSSPDHTYLITKSYIVTHNTSQIAIGHVLWRLGKDPNKSFGILSKSGKEASKTIEALKCEAKGAKILLSSGEWKEVQDLKDWTSVRTLDPVTWRFVDVTARSTFNGMVQCYQVCLANGHKMLLTAEHPLYTHKEGQTGWTKAKDITPSHQVLAIREFDVPECTDAEEIPDEAAELLGYLLAGRKNSATGSIIIRDNNRSELWATRRQKFFERAGWGLERYGRWSLRVTPLNRFESPLDYTHQVVRYKGDWPVDLHPSVWKISRDQAKRLLSAFMSAAYFKPSAHKRWSSNRNGFLSGTTGLGKDRVPILIEHPCFETLDMIRRLFMRVGVRAELSVQPRTRINDHGIWKRPKGNLQRLYRLKIAAIDVSRFFPTRDKKHDDQSPYYFEKVTKVAKLPKFFETWAVEVKEPQHSYISGGVVSHNTYIAESPELKDVFPHLKPGPKWAATSFTVDRSTIRRDPSVIAVGLTGQFLGARLDGIVIDDVDTSETVLTPELRDTTERVVRTKALTRLSEDGWAVAIGNVWHEDDLMHRLVKSGWKAKSLPVLNPETGESNDPELFPLERIYAIRDEDNPTTFAQLYLLKARADGDERFRKEWIESALSKGSNAGAYELIKPPEGLPRVPSGCRTITGVDLGVKKKANADPTAITTILEIPMGKRTEYTLLNIETGRWNAEEIMNKIREQQRLFASEVWVESNGCFVPGTRVLTKSGYQPIETIEPGTLVWTHMGRWRRVTHRFDGTARYVTPVHARGSLSVKCTPNHAFHVRRAGRTPGRKGGHHRPIEPKGWCSIGFPDVPLYLNVAMPTWEPTDPVIELRATKKLAARSINVTEELAVVLGLFMAEGHTSDNQVTWTLNRSEGYLSDFIVQTLKTNGIKSACYERGSTLRVVAHSKQLSEALKIGTGPDKCLPLSWMGWPLPLRLALVRGWLLGDGSVGVNGDRKAKPSYHLTGCTISRNWLMFVRSTLHQAGISTAVAESDTRKTSVIEGRTVNRHSIFRLNITQTGTEQLRSYMGLPVEATRWKSSCWDKIDPERRTSGSAVVIQEDGCWSKMVPHDLEPTETYQYYDDGPVHNLVVEEDSSYTVEDFVVHNAQDLLIQLMNMSGSSYRVNAFYTGRNKYDPMFGLESIAAEMATGCWTFPSYDGTIEGSMPEVQKLCEEMRQYMPGDHTGDVLMSLWIAREGARTSRPKASQAVEFGRIRLRR